MHWVGNCNELNAGKPPSTINPTGSRPQGYAADGYGKINGLAAIVTTFGVGELSAINALAGAYSEFSPVVHVVGCPSTVAQRDGMLLHHTLGNGDFRVFRDMAARVSVAVAELDEARTAAQLVDEAITKCWVRSRPVYVWLPADMVRCKVEGARLKTPLKLEYPPNDKEKEDYVAEVVLKHLRESKSAIVLVDACAIRHRVSFTLTPAPWRR
jgi:pyruvate decarboxylase